MQRGIPHRTPTCPELPCNRRFMQSAGACTHGTIWQQRTRLLIDKGLRRIVGRKAAIRGVRCRHVRLEPGMLGRHVGVEALLRLVAEVLRSTCVDSSLANDARMQT